MCHPYGGTSEWRHTAASLDATTARTYLRRRCHFSRNEDAVELFVRSHFGRESSEVNSRINLSQFLWSCYLLDLQISMLYLLTYMASAGGVYKLLGPEKNKADTVYVKGSQFSHFKPWVCRQFIFGTGGAATICQRLQTQLGPDNVLMNQPVSFVSIYNDRVYIETKVCGKINLTVGR